MKGWLKQSWKVISIVILSYAVLSSFFVPMAPGIYQVNLNLTQDTAVLELEVIGYNTQFNGQKNTLWLQQSGGSAVPAKSVEVKGQEKLECQFEKVNFKSAGNYNIWLHNEVNKTLFLPQAVYLSQTDSVNFSATKFDIEPYIESREGFFIPFKNILYETIRNLNFHVTMWFVLLALMTAAVIYALKTLRATSFEADRKSHIAVQVGLFFAILGVITGSIWAKNTWGAYWVNDPKLNGAALSVLIYMAYLVLRQSIPDPTKKAKLSAVYNVFAYVLMIVFIQVLPRLTDSLHPGNGGNPAFSQYDLDNNLRAIFYPATLGWILIGFWIWNIKVRIQKLELNNEELD